MKRKSRRMLRRGKGRAFLRFLVGEAVLLVVCACVYLFVLQGMIELPGVERLLEENVNLTGSGSSASPQSTPTVEPLPTPTPVPQELYAPEIDPKTLADMNLMDSDWLKSCLFSFSEIQSEGVVSLAMKGHAYLEGMDARNGSIYIVLRDAQSGQYLAVYQAQRTPPDDTLSFEDANGVHLEEAYYRACVDITAYAEMPYQVCICVVNGARAGLTVLSPMPE